MPSACEQIVLIAMSQQPGEIWLVSKHGRMGLAASSPLSTANRCNLQSTVITTVTHLALLMLFHRVHVKLTKSHVLRFIRLYSIAAGITFDELLPVILQLV